MSDAEWARVRSRTIDLYFAITGLLLIGIGILLVYTIRLGPILGPGVQSSFGYATSLLFLMGALLVHVVDRAYRLYPLGRRVRTNPLPPVTERNISNFLRVVVLIVAAAAVAYILGSLIAT